MLDVLMVDGGVVTIAARVAPPAKGGNYIQIDVSPDNARRLALFLLAMAKWAEVTPRFEEECERTSQTPQLRWN